MLLFMTEEQLTSSPSQIHSALMPTQQTFSLRGYQGEAVDKAVDFLTAEKYIGHGLQILPTGSGKSIVIANIAKRLTDGKVLVLQPNVEILDQNYKKLLSYGYTAGIYSASAGQKFIGSHVTYATIGSIIKKKHLFREFKYLLIDECDLVNAKEGMYNDFIREMSHIRTCGFTATPYRLYSSREYGSMLKFLTRTIPKIFTHVNYVVQNKTLFDAGYLAKLEYYDQSVVDRNQLQLNSAGTDFTESSIRAYYRKINMTKLLIDLANRLLLKRKNLLVFASLIEEAERVAQGIPGAAVIHGEISDTERTSILTRFKNGSLRCVVNVNILTVGFDHPALEALLIGRSTMSLRWYYQVVGRAMRIHPNKESAWIVDLAGNYKFFGKVEDLEVRKSEKGLYSVWNAQNNRQLTNITFRKT